MTGRSWNRTIGILILINGIVFFLHFVYNSINIPAFYSGLSVWDNFPYFFYRIGHDPDSRQALVVMGLIFQILEFIMVVLILVFVGLMKSHYQDKNLNKFWKKILAGGITQILLWFFSIFKNGLFHYLYDKYLSHFEAWEDNVAYDVFSSLYPGIWDAIIGIVLIVLAVNHLLAWLNFRAFSKEHMHHKISNGALLISLGAIPIMLGEILKDCILGLEVFWTLLDWGAIETLPEIVQNIGRDSWMHLDFTTAIFLGIISYIVFTVGFIITGIQVMGTKKPANITDEPVLEHFHDSSWKFLQSKTAKNQEPRNLNNLKKNNVRIVGKF